MKEWQQEEHREQKMYAGADGDAVPEEFREARNKGLYYLQFSGKTENEMRKKLAEQEFSPASVEDAVLFLKHYRYLDDEDYARRYVEKNGNKKSIRQMKFDLRQKGVSDDLVEMVFKVVRGSFSQRRKNLANSLSSAMGMEKATVINAIREAGLSENIRPEQLSLQQFADVSNRL